MSYTRLHFLPPHDEGVHRWDDWQEAVNHPRWIWGEYFTPAEFKSENDPNPELLLQHKAMTQLWMLRVAWKKPIIVASGYRSELYNDSVGGAENSYHTKGRAFDIHTNGWTFPTKLKFVVLATSVGFRGFSIYETFIHIDNGPLRTW